MRKALMVFFVIGVMPFVNFGISMLLGLQMADNVNGFGSAWAVGFILVMGELAIITAPCMIPVFGTFYQAKIGRLLGFPDPVAEKMVDIWRGKH